jgi:hypothetical protein
VVVVDTVVVVGVVAGGVAGGGVPVPPEHDDGRTVVAMSMGVSAMPGLMRTEPNLPGHTRELRIPDRSETAMRTGNPPPAK